MDIKHAKLTEGASLPEQFVTMSNALTRSAHGLSLAEKRVIAAAIAQLDSVRMNPSQPAIVRISAHEFAETYGLSHVSAYEQLKAAAENLFERYVRAVENTRKGPKETKMRWVGRCSYHEGAGWIEIAFWHEILPHLVGLRGQFTTYKLAQAATMRSIYSWRLFEMFQQFKSTGFVRKTIEDFCFAMEAPPSCSNDFGQLRRRIIEPAVKELSEKDGYTVEWKAIREGGRKVTGLEFNFTINPQQKLL